MEAMSISRFEVKLTLSLLILVLVALAAAVSAPDRSYGGLAGKIMRCLGSITPLRITDIPYIRKKHHEIPPQTLKRPSVRSLSNCIVCHRTAENDVYDEHQIKIKESFCKPCIHFLNGIERLFIAAPWL